MRAVPAAASLLALLAVAGCDRAETQPVADETDAPRAPLGKADASGSCLTKDGDACGGPSDGACWCDDLCAHYGDCCQDYAEVCECEPLTCAADECGTFDDGCGGTIDCGPCAIDPVDPDSCGGTPLGQSNAAAYFEPDALGTNNLLTDAAYFLYSRPCFEAGCAPWERREDLEAATRMDEGEPVVRLVRDAPGATVEYIWNGYVEDSWARHSPFRPLPVPDDVSADRYRRYGSGHTDALRDATFRMDSATLTEDCYRAVSVPFFADGEQIIMITYGRVMTP